MIRIRAVAPIAYLLASLTVAGQPVDRPEEARSTVPPPTASDDEPMQPQATEAQGVVGQTPPPRVQKVEVMNQPEVQEVRGEIRIVNPPEAQRVEGKVSVASDELRWFWLLVTFLSGAVVAVFSEVVRQWIFRPRIELGIKNDAAHLAETLALVPVENVTRSPVSGVQPQLDQHGRQCYAFDACYLRVRACNRRGALARSCRVYLIGIDYKPSDDDEFSAVEFYDPVQLAWASRGALAFEAIDIPRGAHQFVDIVAAHSIDESSLDLRVQFKPFRELDVANKPGVYRFTAMIAGDNFNPQNFAFECQWDGTWNGFNAINHQ